MEHILLALTIIVGIGVLVFVVVLIIIGAAALKLGKRANGLIDHYEKEVAPHIAPLVQSARGMVDDLSPKMKQISTNALDVSNILRSEAQHITVSLSDVVERTHQQATRVDNLVSNTINGIGQVAESVQESLSAPLRHLSSVLNGVRAGVGSFRGKRPHKHHHPNQARNTAATPAPTVVIRKTETGEDRPASNA